MPDREKVIEWLKEISLRPCDFTTEDFDATQTEHLADDALALLREQEPVEPHVEHDSDDDSWYYGCGACHEAIDYKDKYCRHCGRQVKWDT